jgi:hypothetical protein
MPRKKSPVTPPGIDPGTFRLVAQFLNHYATPGPQKPIVRPYIELFGSSTYSCILLFKLTLCTGCSNYETANMLLKSSRPAIAQHLRSVIWWQACAIHPYGQGSSKCSISFSPSKWSFIKTRQVAVIFSKLTFPAPTIFVTFQ